MGKSEAISGVCKQRNGRNCGLFKIISQKLHIQDQRDGNATKGEIKLAMWEQERNRGEKLLKD